MLATGTHGRARRHQAVRVRGEDAGRELRRAHLRPRRRVRAQRVDDARAAASRPRTPKNASRWRRSSRPRWTASRSRSPGRPASAATASRSPTSSARSRNRSWSLRWDGAPLGLDDQGRAVLAHPGAGRVRGDAGGRGAGERPAPDPGALLRRARHAPGPEGPGPPVEGRVHHRHPDTTCSRCT